MPLPIELVREVLAILATEEDPSAPCRTRQADLAACAASSCALRELAQPFLLARPSFSSVRAIRAFQERVRAGQVGQHVVEFVLRPRGPIAPFEEAWRALLQSRNWSGLTTVAFMYAHGIQRRFLVLGALSSAVGATLTTLVLCHLDLEMPDSALKIRPFPVLRTLIIRHCSIPQRNPLPPKDNILPIGTPLSTPLLTTLHIHSGKSQGAITLDDFVLFSHRLVRLSIATYERPLPLLLDQFTSLTSFELWWPQTRYSGDNPLTYLARTNSIREVSVRDLELERGTPDECDGWSDVGSDIEEYCDTADRSSPRGSTQRERFKEVVRGLVQLLERVPPLLPALRTLVLARVFERCAEEDRRSKVEMGRLEKVLRDLDVELRFAERYWASESAGQGFVLPLDVAG
ncbi:hypothetical protein RQP46_010501 [Phenoliferia psychrophenolica]